MDPVIGLVTALKADAAVNGTTGGDVFDFEIPLSLEQQGLLPIPLVVVIPHGGPKGPDLLYVNDTHMQVRCYAQTPHLAYVLYTQVFAVFKSWRPSVWAGTYIHFVNPQSAPIPFRDSNAALQYAYNVSTWEVRCSDLTV